MWPKKPSHLSKCLKNIYNYVFSVLKKKKKNLCVYYVAKKTLPPK